MGRREAFLAILEEMFGTEIVGRLVRDDLSLRSEGRSEITEDQANHQVAKLFGLLFPDSAPACHTAFAWTLDFPGWLGALELEQALPAKKVMVVGQEPLSGKQHISISYGLHDGGLHDDGDPEDRLWPAIRDCLKLNPDDCLATDLCFFAVQGGGSELGAFDKAMQADPGCRKSWRELRECVAQRYLRGLIKVVKPYLIVANGQDSFGVLREILGIGEDYECHGFSFGTKRTLSVRIGQIESLMLVGIPHTGDQNRWWWRRCGDNPGLGPIAGRLDKWLRRPPARIEVIDEFEDGWEGPLEEACGHKADDRTEVGPVVRFIVANWPEVSRYIPQEAVPLRRGFGVGDGICSRPDIASDAWVRSSGGADFLERPDVPEGFFWLGVQNRGGSEYLFLMWRRGGRGFWFYDQYVVLMSGNSAESYSRTANRLRRALAAWENGHGDVIVSGIR